MHTVSLRRLSVLVLVMGLTVGHTLANSAEMMTVRPALANVHSLVVRIEMIPFATYPSHESDLLEPKIRAQVEALLIKDGFAIVKKYDAEDNTPELALFVDTSRDGECPSLVALQMRAMLRDRVTIHSRRIGRFEDNLVLWEWWDAGGEMSIVQREDVSSSVEEWAREAITAFVKEVRFATASSSRAKRQK